MSDDLRALSDYQLTLADDEASGKGDQERLAAIKAEKMRRANNNKRSGLSPTLKAFAYLAFFVLGSQGLAAFGVGGLIPGVIVSIVLTQIADYLVAMQKERRNQRA